MTTTTGFALEARCLNGVWGMAYSESRPALVRHMEETLAGHRLNSVSRDHVRLFLEGLMPIDSKLSTLGNCFGLYLDDGSFFGIMWVRNVSVLK